MRIRLSCDRGDLQSELWRVASLLQLPLLTGYPDAVDAVLELSAEGWILHAPRVGGLGQLRLDYSHGRTAWRLRQAGRKSPLARAVGIKPGQQLKVIDATAGLGRDGAILATLGCQVTMMERHPVMALLLDDALKRSGHAEFSQRIHVIHQQSERYLEQMVEPADVVYLDPMYPHRQKSALVKQEMRILRALVGADHDAGKLLAAALTCPVPRVVIKRPRVTPPLLGSSPSFSIKSPNTRYDIYLQKVGVKS